MMVESEAYELSEKEMLGAVKFGHEQMAPVIDMIIDLAKDAAKQPFKYEHVTDKELSKKKKKEGNKSLTDAF
jgi:polyribonucleotide nucleotidyltransferase